MSLSRLRSVRLSPNKLRYSLLDFVAAFGPLFSFHVLYGHDSALHGDTSAIAVIYHGIAIHAEDADETGMGFQQVPGLGVDAHYALTVVVMDDNVVADIVVVADHAEQVCIPQTAFQKELQN